MSLKESELEEIDNFINLRKLVYPFVITLATLKGSNKEFIVASKSDLIDLAHLYDLGLQTRDIRFTMTAVEFIKLVNKQRLAGGWYGACIMVDGKKVLYKGFETWLQVFKVNNIDHASPMDMKVGDFKIWLATPWRT